MKCVVYQTHMEITPYYKGLFPDLELSLSKKDKPTHSLIPIGYYIDTKTKTLYIPRGVSIPYIRQLIGKDVEYSTDLIECEPIFRGNMVLPPKNKNQERAIDFLYQRGEFVNTVGYTQLGLNLPTGEGKTYCTINALVTQKRRAVIICHNTVIRDQWLTRFKEYTDIAPGMILVIDGRNVLDSIINGKIDPLDYDYFLVLHQTLEAYACPRTRNYENDLMSELEGEPVSNDHWERIQTLFSKLKVFVKVFDEAHLYFENSLMLDYFTNVPMTYYLTATFGRSDPQQNRIYNQVYSRMLRFGEELEKKKHTILFALMFDSNPTNADKRKVEHANSYGFSAANYMNYEIENSTALEDAIKYALKCSERIQGTRIITSNTIASVEKFAELASEWYPNWRCQKVHSHMKDRDEIDLEDVDLISCTSKYLGTGADIKGLRILIAAEPMASSINIEQLIGRLRPYYNEDGEELETLMFLLVDVGFRSCRERFEKTRHVFQNIAKKCYIKYL